MTDKEYSDRIVAATDALNAAISEAHEAGIRVDVQTDEKTLMQDEFPRVFISTRAYRPI